MNIPLSSEQIKKVNPKIQILTYPQLQYIDDIHYLVNPSRRNCIILYQTHHDQYRISGHYCILSLKKRGKKDELNFFDSYGSVPDDQFEKIDNSYRILSGQIYNFLTRIMYFSPYDGVRYNSIKLQSDHSSVCGRYCILFSKSDLDAEKFATKIKEISERENVTPDELVLSLTNSVRII